MDREDKIKEMVENQILNHLDGIDEIFLSKESVNIITDRNLTPVGMISAFITKVVFELYDNNAFSMSDDNVKYVLDMVEDMSKNTEKHPYDTIMLLLKILSDLMLQIIVLEQYKENDNENNN